MCVQPTPAIMEIIQKEVGVYQAEQPKKLLLKSILLKLLRWLSEKVIIFTFHKPMECCHLGYHAQEIPSCGHNRGNPFSKDKKRKD